jgi:hypothetical protein
MLRGRYALLGETRNPRGAPQPTRGPLQVDRAFVG